MNANTLAGVLVDLHRAPGEAVPDHPQAVVDVHLEDLQLDAAADVDPGQLVVAPVDGGGASLIMVIPILADHYAAGAVGR